MGAILLSIVSCGDENRDAALETVQRPFSNQLGGGSCPKLQSGLCTRNHEKLTTEGLSFLKLDVQNYLAAENAAFDARNNAPLPGTAFAHFDNCTFSDSSSRILQELTHVAALAASEDIAPFTCPTTDVATPIPHPACAGPSRGKDMLDDFAHALHTIQDFYSHTNWVERNASALFFDQLGPFPVLSPCTTVHGVFVAEQLCGNLFAPRGNPNTLSYPEKVEPDALDRGLRLPALISGDTTQNLIEKTFPANCPEIRGRGRPYTVTHDELAKDDSTEHSSQFFDAFSAARSQTTHEWCRLLEEVQSLYGRSAVAHVCDQWVDDRDSANAACPEFQRNALCPCPSGKVICGRACVDVQSDANNCGACGIVCGSGETCNAGACQASGGGNDGCGNFCCSTVLVSCPDFCGPGPVLTCDPFIDCIHEIDCSVRVFCCQTGP